MNTKTDTQRWLISGTFRFPLDDERTGDALEALFSCMGTEQDATVRRLIVEVKTVV